MFIASLYIITKTWKQLKQQQTNGWRCGIYTHNGIQLSHKIEGNNATCSNLDGPRDYLIKWNKLGRERQIYDIAWMCNLKKNTNELINKTEIDPQTSKANTWLPKGEGGDK